MTTKLIASDRIYIPESRIDMTELKDKLVKDVYIEDKCQNCEYFSERHCDVCDSCPHYVGTFKLYNEKDIKGKPHYGVPLGYRTKVKSIMTTNKVKVIDKRSAPKFKNKIKFTGSLKEHQIPACKDMIKAGYGILEAPPRSGKTVMGTHIICKLGMKTLILASQRDWLVNFYETIVGNKRKKVVAMTNVPDLATSKNKIVGFPKTLKDFETLDICLCTYQMFNSENGKKLLRKVRKKFGVIMLDECHDAGAPVLSRVISQFTAKHRFGLSGTPDRKDGRMFIANAVIGPVKHKSKVKSLKPSVTFIETHVYSDKNFSLPVYAVRFLERQKKRTELIVKHVIADVKAGHSVVIPGVHVKYMEELCHEINKAYEDNIAVVFHGKVKNRQQIIDDATSGKIKVVIGTRKIVQVGINVPRWSSLYEICPISNPPKFKQETARILTDVPDKQSPVIRFFLDDISFSRGCLRTCLYKDPGIFSMKFHVDSHNRELASKYASRARIDHSKSKKKGRLRF